jgi:glycosyltransferase involved in cell wall biosynthesis
LNKLNWKNPILFGPAVYSHPCDDPNLFERLPVQKVLVSCEWFKAMYCQQWPSDRVEVWPAGIDTSVWEPSTDIQKNIDILIYDKVRWEHDRYQQELIEPIRSQLSQHHLTSELIRYGFYREDDFQQLLRRSKAMIFLCEHETQGFAYLQALASGVPILAWDRGSFWQDPTYYPHHVQFQPVSSVPYWDDRCGVKFQSINDFPSKLDEFLTKLSHDQFAPRNYILNNLTLKKCAQRYVEIYHEIKEHG